MFKWALGFAAACIVAIAVFAVHFALTFGTPEYFIKTPIPKGARVIEKLDNHGGFHGDGTTWILIKLDETQQNELIASIQGRPGWSRLPLSDELKRMSGFMDYDDKRKLPAGLTKGYYYFHDSQLDWDYPKDDDIKKPLYDRHSTNFIIGMLDTENKLLYIYRTDT